MADPLLPVDIDVLIIGSGYTGMNVVPKAARTGCETLVVDTEAAGRDCSAMAAKVSTAMHPV